MAIENPRPEKVAVVTEVRERMSSANATLLTEYRGLKVDEIAQLRQSVRAAGGDYKIYKNTLVRLAVADLGIEGLDDLLVGPTAVAFVDGDAVLVAKALKEFSKTAPNLVVKGGVLGRTALSAADAGALADVAPREVVLAQLAGALAAPLQKFAGLLGALPRNLAYGLSALIDKRGGPEAAPAEGPDQEPAAGEAPAAEAPAQEPAAAEAPAAEAPAAEAPAAETAEPQTSAPDAPAPDAPAPEPEAPEAPEQEAPAPEAAAAADPAEAPEAVEPAAAGDAPEAVVPVAAAENPEAPATDPEAPAASDQPTPDGTESADKEQ